VCPCCPWLVLAPRVLQLCTNHFVWVVCRPVWVTKACQLFLVYPGTSSTPLSPPSSARSRERAPSSNSFRIATYLDPQVGPLGTWERVISYFHLVIMQVTTCSRKNSMGCIQCVTQVLFVLYNLILIYSFWIWWLVHMYPLVERWNCWVAPFSLPPISIQRFQNMYLSSSLLLLLFCHASTSQRSNNGNFPSISRS